MVELNNLCVMRVRRAQVTPSEDSYIFPTLDDVAAYLVTEELPPPDYFSPVKIVDSEIFNRTKDYNKISEI